MALQDGAEINGDESLVRGLLLMDSRKRWSEDDTLNVGSGGMVCCGALDGLSFLKRETQRQRVVFDRTEPK